MKIFVKIEYTAGVMYKDEKRILTQDMYISYLRIDGLK